MTVISRDDARALVGKMLFGAEWINDLTKAQIALLAADFGPKPKALSGEEVFEKPCPAERREEFDVALGRRARMRIQTVSADAWIETFAHRFGLGSGANFFRRSMLDEAIKEHQERSAPLQPRGKPGGEPIERNRVAAAMKADLEDGKATLAQLRNRDASASTYKTSTGTARNASKQIESELKAQKV
jgi:hypothetical protein